MYQVLFFKDYPNIYNSIIPHIKFSAVNKFDILWYYLLSLAKIAYDVGNWYVLTDYTYYHELLNILSIMTSGSLIFECLLKDQKIMMLLKDEYIDPLCELLSKKEEIKHNNLTELLKVIIKNLFSAQETSISEYIEFYLNDGNEEMVEWLLKTYRNHGGSEMDNYIIETLDGAGKRYKQLLVKYKFI